MAYYHNLITTKSWQLLKGLQKELDFILIGGWAVFLYTQALKSKDIDLITTYPELEKLREKFEVTKNNRLKKYEARKGEVEIDIYLPFYSNPGLPAEEIEKFQVSFEGFKLPAKETLAVLKQQVLKARTGTVKGRKDLIDLISLFQLKDFDWKKYHQLIKCYKLSKSLAFLEKQIKQIREIKELDLNIHQIARVKKQILVNLGR